ncbi:hypothetical protein RGQ29_023857 [Quercus rubra]|uniref:Transmembrane protein n=1 Tax=Quercus rubra TaxID=3512 RepID=A0AAN7IRJ9_QUERU|nr:hypothetical protein RGQ29_023857 [Quercus rubra]
MLPIPNLTQTKNKKVSEVSLSTVQNSNSSPYLSNLHSLFFHAKKLRYQKQHQTKQKTLLFVIIMGTMCCSESDDGGFDFTSILIVLVLALLLMALCTPPQRRVVAVYRCY